MVEYKFCPLCAGKLAIKIKDDKPRQVCSECGFVFYQNPRPCVAVLVEKGEKIMLARRGIEPYRDWWDLPGGFIEEGEHPEEAVHREIAEETGLEVEIIKLLGVVNDTYGDTGIHTMNFHYLTRFRNGMEKPQDDVNEIKWFSASELPEKIAFHNCRSAVENWKKTRTG
ncbi:MAG: NUDIX domain-containing protein [Prolixibacteraceae bacterium]